MYKIVINKCYGGFSLSSKAQSLFIKYSTNHKNVKNGKLDYYSLSLHDTTLIQVVHELGEKANGNFAKLEIIETDEKQYIIDEYDGMESLITPNSIEWINLES